MAEENTHQSDPVVRIAGSVSEDELRSSFLGPAIFSNKFYVTNGPAGMRLSFMEGLLPTVQPIFRAAVLISYGDAIALRDVLTKQLADIEPQIKEAERAAMATAEGAIRQGRDDDVR